MKDRNARSRFTSGWGVVVTTAGAAIGLGNIWRFPYMMGEHGGSAFLVLYLLLVVAFGLPGLMAECALGRLTRRGPMGALHAARMPGAWPGTVLLLVTITMAGSYYGAILGDVLCETVGAPAGGARDIGWRFAALVATIGLSCVAVAFGLRRGIERLSRIALPLFAVLFVGLIVYVLRLEGTMAGLRAYLVFRPADMEPETALAALGQAFFSLGLGGTLMVTYGSYLRDDDSIPGIAVGTATADVGAALLAGMIIVPAVLALGLQMDSGPRLLFVVMPEVFARMPGGALVGAVFFGAVFVVGMLSLMAAYEVVVAAAEDRLGWSRARATAGVGALQLVLGVPAVLSGGYVGWSDLIWGTTMMPVGSALAVIGLTWSVGRARAMEQLARHTHLPVSPLLFYWMKYVLPLGIIVMLVYGWVSFLLG